MKAFAMLHWTRIEPVALLSPEPRVATPWGPAAREPSGRARHARMLAHAATRRRAAVKSLSDECRIDAIYWKACAPQAVASARSLRRSGLPVLP